MGRQLRVLLSFPGRIGTPGIGSIGWHQATGLARAGAEIHVACGSAERTMPGVRLACETMRIPRGPKIPYRLVGRERAAALHDRQVARFLRRHPDGFDVVHAWPAGAELTLQTARGLGIPAFLERPNAHTAFAFEVVEAECSRIGMRLHDSSPHAPNPVKLAREQREFAAADALLCPSSFVASTHAQRGEPRERLLRHRYGYDPERFWSMNGGERGFDEPLVVAFVGRLEPRKGVHLALQAWQAAGLRPGAKLILCGLTEPGYEAVLDPLLKSPGVEVTGPMSDPAPLMRCADALVLPSLEEGSALVTYEASACGAALLVSDRSGAYVHHGEDALIHVAGDVEALASHYRLLDQDPQLRERLRATSLRRSGRLTWDAAALELIAAYRAGMATVGARGPA
jgi:glycosyltransferase involved in cell wall biosynthesis